MQDMFNNEATILPKEDEVEVWATLPDLSTYEFSSFGKVRNAKTGRILKGSEDSSGYPKVNLKNDKTGDNVTYNVHRLIALAFWGDKRDDEHNFVDHIDRCRINNYYQNLRFVSASENSTNKNFGANGRKKIYNNTTPIVLIKKDGTIVHFKNIIEASEATNLAKSTIHELVAGRRKNCSFGTFQVASLEG